MLHQSVQFSTSFVQNHSFRSLKHQQPDPTLNPSVPREIRNRGRLQPWRSVNKGFNMSAGNCHGLGKQKAPILKSFLNFSNFFRISTYIGSWLAEEQIGQWAPPKSMHAKVAPFRRMLMLRRDGDIQYEKHWERWAEPTISCMPCEWHSICQEQYQNQ